MDQLSDAEKSRYSRHIILDEVGEKGQLLLKQAKVLIVGAGGLGAPLIQYLAAAGVGAIGIVDHDKIEDSNLQRQVLFTTNDIGRYKAEVAKERVLAQNPFVEVKTFVDKFSSKNALEIANGYDMIADGTDNFPTRYLVNDTCVILGIPNAYASIFKFEGQVTVFNLKNQDGSFTANYRDLYPVPPAVGTVPSCSEAGVMGVLPGIIGALQANEVVKISYKKTEFWLRNYCT
jgi:adenylyltransferase/sulfurtransferase